MIHLLGWRDEGRSYRRLEQSLKRWLGVTLYYENAWWDKAQKRWVDAHFHLLDDLVLYRRPTPHAGVSAKAGDAALSSFTWNEMVFRSFQAGFLKKLDLDFYRRLKLAAAKRMYRFLDKQFHFSKHAPLQAAGLRVRTHWPEPSIRCRPTEAAPEPGDRRIGAGRLPRCHCRPRNAFTACGGATGKSSSFVLRSCEDSGGRSVDLSDLENRLVERGVTASAAVQLVREHAADLIEGKIAVFDALRQKDDRRISRNPAGFLVQSIRKDYAAAGWASGK